MRVYISIMGTRANDLRRNATDAEQALWRSLRARQLHGHKLRRQHPIGPYVADFACLERRLIVEVDGGQHAESASDEARTAWLERKGWSVIRFWNNDVLSNIEGVLDSIARALDPAD